jgi:hypothetical protein
METHIFPPASCDQRAHDWRMFSIPRADVCRSLQIPLCRHQHHLRCRRAALGQPQLRTRAGEHLIKRHKSPLASDRISCRSPLVNLLRLIVHTTAY